MEATKTENCLKKMGATNRTNNVRAYPRYLEESADSASDNPATIELPLLATAAATAASSSSEILEAVEARTASREGPASVVKVHGSELALLSSRLLVLEDLEKGAAAASDSSAPVSQPSVSGSAASSSGLASAASEKASAAADCSRDSSERALEVSAEKLVEVGASEMVEPGLDNREPT